MRKFFTGLVLFCLTLILAGPAWGQLDNRVFTASDPGKIRQELDGRVADTTTAQPNRQAPVQAGDVRISLYAFTFLRNDEYFNKLVDGIRLLGTQLNPQLVYYPSKSLRLEGGIFIWKDYGNPVLRQVAPTFRGTWTKGSSQFIFGTILPTLNHEYIEPLYDFKQLFLAPLEEGVQYRLTNKRVFLDVWVNWIKQEYKYSNYKEEISGGLSSRFCLTSDQRRVQVSIPFQLTARHHGGQIDTARFPPVQSLFDYATGIIVRAPLRGPVLEAVRVNAYGLLYDDHSYARELPYYRGHAFYLNGTLETRYLDVMLSYFQGYQFYAPLGAGYYQSIGTSTGAIGYTIPNRKVLFVRFLRDFRVSDAAAVTVRFEPVYDFNQRNLDYSFGFYLSFRQDWLLGNLSRRERTK